MNTAAATSGSGPGIEDQPSLLQLLVRYVIVGVLIACILFFISGRLSWLRAWLYIAVTLGVQILVGAVLHRKNPELLGERRRVRAGTKPWDRILAPFVAFVGPVGIWSVAAWDVRLHWPPMVSPAASAAAFAVCVLASLFVFWAMLSNPFFAATVRIQTDRNQVVVDQGPYGYLRHPGYSGALLFTMASPIALGSWKALIPAAVTAAILVLRTALEDITLRSELHGYAEYAARVRARLIPGLW